MAKKTASKQLNMLGMGIFAVMGFVFGLVLFGVLYGWYASGYADTTTVMTTALLLIVVMYVIFILAYGMGKKMGYTYEKAIWLGIGFTIAMILAGLILGYMGLESTVSVTAGAFVALSRKLSSAVPMRRIKA